jgi:hypothetical protein
MVKKLRNVHKAALRKTSLVPILRTARPNDLVAELFSAFLVAEDIT